MKIEIKPNDPRFCVEFLPSKLTVGDVRIEVFDREGSSCCEINMGLNEAEDLQLLLAGEIAIAEQAYRERARKEKPR